MKIAHFAVHNGRVFAMAENGETFATTIIGNTGWVRVAKRITGDEPTDSKHYLNKQYARPSLLEVEPALETALVKLGDEQEATAEILGRKPTTPPKEVQNNE